MAYAKCQNDALSHGMGSSAAHAHTHTLTYISSSYLCCVWVCVCVTIDTPSWHLTPIARTPIDNVANVWPIDSCGNSMCGGCDFFSWERMQARGERERAQHIARKSMLRWVFACLLLCYCWPLMSFVALTTTCGSSRNNNNKHEVVYAFAPPT